MSLTSKQWPSVPPVPQPLRAYLEQHRDFVIRFAGSVDVDNALTETGALIVASDDDGTPSALPPGSEDYPLVSNGPGELPAYERLTGNGIEEAYRPENLFTVHFSTTTALGLVAGSTETGFFGSTNVHHRFQIPAGKQVEVVRVTGTVQTGALAGTYSFRVGLRRYTDPNTTTSFDLFASLASEWQTTSTSHWISITKTAAVGESLLTIQGNSANDDIGVAPFLRAESGNPGSTTTADRYVSVTFRIVTT